MGTKYKPEELLAHRDNWWRRVQRSLQSPDEDSTLEAFILDIIDATDDPGIGILNALASCLAASSVDFAKDPVPDVSLVSIPSVQLVEGPFDWLNPGSSGIPISWPWHVVERTIRALRSRGLLHFHSVHGTGGFGNIYLSELGQTVVRSPAFPGS
jgi:hypothetical protein